MWPKYIDFYMHASDEDNYFEGKEHGLSEEAADEFARTGYEMHFWLQLNEDGTTKVLKINDVDVSHLDIPI